MTPGEGDRMYFFVTRLVRWDHRSALRAFCDVSVDQELLIKGIRVVEGRHGPFVSMPRQKSKDEKWHDVVVPLTRETKLELSRIILEAFQNGNGGGHNGR
jgi:stage V sporulation protein G